MSGPPAMSGPPSERYLFERRQLVSMRLASLAAYDTPNLPDVLNEMLVTFATTTPADIVYILLLKERDAAQPVLALTSKYDAVHSSSAMLPADFQEDQVPELFHALRHNQRMIQDEAEVKIEVEGEDELRSGPVLVQPIARGDRGYGLVIAGNPHSKRTFTEDDGRLCQVLAVSVGAVIARDEERASVPLVADDHTATEERGSGTLPAFPSAAQ